MVEKKTTIEDNCSFVLSHYTLKHKGFYVSTAVFDT